MWRCCEVKITAADARIYLLCADLCSALLEAGIADATVGVRGSSVTGVSFKTGSPFGPSSDIDFFVESGQLTNGLKTSSSIPGFVHPDRIARAFPALADFSANWSAALGRDVNVGGFTPGNVPAGPVIYVPIGP